MRSIKFLTLILLLWCVLPVHAQAESDLLSRINSLRSSLGLAPYNLNSALNAAASNHARWMIESGQVSHTQPDGSTPRTRAAVAGYSSQWVSENIYGGTNATTDTAWTFWVNSSVHYRGLTNANYDDVGIAVARGDWGNAYVLVFGDSDGSWEAPRAANNAEGDGENAAPPPPPSFIVGVDALGNLMHEIQPGDTLGDIALLYGYTWDDLPYMMEINEMDEYQARELKVGAVFLVPPYDGTYTPTPAPVTDEPTATQTPLPSDTPQPTQTYTPLPTATFTPVALAATSAAVITDAPTATPIAVADAAEIPPPENEPRISQVRGRSPWLYVAIGVQVLLVIGAGVELVLRQLRR